MPGKGKTNRIDFIELPAASAASVAKARAFYTDVFEWQFQDWGDDYVDTKKSGVGFGINGDATHRAEAPLVVIYCADIECARKRVIAAGGKITREIFSFPGGRRFHFADPAGNVLAIWSDL